MSEDSAKRPKPPADFDENPEWTEQMFARARPAREVHGAEMASEMVRKRGRPVLPPEKRKQQVTLRLSPDVLTALRGSGAGWQSRADDLLREALLGRTARGS